MTSHVVANIGKFKGKVFQVWEKKKIKVIKENSDEEGIGDEDMQKAKKTVILLVKVYFADGLPKVKPNIMENLRKGFSRPCELNVDQMDPEVVVFFAGEKCRTERKNQTAKANWNQILVFTVPFHKIDNNLKLSVCHQDHEIGCAYLTVIDGLSFGPSYVYLKSQPGNQYAGRLLTEINLEESDQRVERVIYKVEKAQKPDRGSFIPDIEFLLFGCLNEATMIDKQFGNRDIRFTLQMDAVGRDPMDVTYSCDLATPSRRTLPINMKYWYLNYDEKPCIWLKNKCADQRKRLFVCNILSKLKLKISECLFLFEELSNRNILLELEDMAKSYKRVFEESLQPESYDTKLDKERKTKCLWVIDNIINAVCMLKDDYSEYWLKMLETLKSKLQSMEEDPQAMVPDVVIWMESEGKRVGYAKIPQTDIIFSHRESEKGKLCGIPNTIFFKSIELSNEEFMVLAKVECFFWLGLVEDQRHCKSMFPGTPEIECIKDGIPYTVKYTDQQVFQLEAHIYQACSLICYDLSRHPKCLARVFIGEHYKDTQVQEFAVNPTFDETLVLKNVVISGGIERIQQYPPTVIVEIIDDHAIGKASFLGRVVTSVSLSKKLPKLHWYDITLTQTDEDGGQLLAAFELKEGESEESFGMTDYDEEGDVIHISPEIKLSFSCFRLEILFWGLRELNVKKIEKPSIEIECAGFPVNSSILNNYKKDSNFHPSFQVIDLNLPDQAEYLPAFTIKLLSTKSFGRADVVAFHVVRSLNKYYFNSEESIRSLPAGKLSMPQSSVEESDKNPAIYLVKKMSLQWFITEQILLNEDAQMEDWWARYFLSIEDKQKEEGYMSPVGATMDPSARHKSLMLSLYPRVDLSKCLGRDGLTSGLNPPNAMGFKVYPCELENVPEFSGFQEWLHSFELTKEKNVSRVSRHDHRMGVFKGCFRVYKTPLPQIVVDPLLCMPGKNGYLLSGLPKNKPLRVFVRAYVVKALDLKPSDITSSADPYLVMQVGHHIFSDKDNYIRKEVNPTFGKCFEFVASFPADSILRIQVYDWELMMTDKLIGETVIDLENRYYSRHRATCGLPRLYQMEGPNEWRDSLKPSEILSRLCMSQGLSKPEVVENSIRIGNRIYEFEEEVFTNYPIGEENMFLCLLHKWSEIGLQGCSLVPEHVETRTLYLPNKPGKAQGKLLMWLDLFEEDTVPPSIPREISIRQPESYELRVVIWNTDEVILNDDAFFTGEKMSDIYVKGWLTNKKKSQSTDVHYRSLTGEGNFNYRFIFPFNYLEGEKEIIVSRKVSVLSNSETLIRVPPILHLEVWDAENFHRDDRLGFIYLNLNELPRAAKTKEMCTLNVLTEEAPRMSIFKIKRIRGWWPVYQMQSIRNTKKLILTGKIEAELLLLTEEEAQKSPAGLGRKEPDELPKPKRPVTSFVNYMNPVKTLRYALWKNYKGQIVKFLLISALIILVIIFLYSIPGYAAKKVMGV